MGKPMPDTETRLLRACLPRMARGESSCTREARRLTRLGGPLEHRNFSATRNKLRKMRDAAGIPAMPHGRRGAGKAAA